MFRCAFVAALLLLCLPVGEARADVCSSPRIRTADGCVTRAQVLRHTKLEQSRNRDMAVLHRLRFEGGASCHGSIDRLPRSAAAGFDRSQELRHIDKPAVRKDPNRLRGRVYPENGTTSARIASHNPARASRPSGICEASGTVACRGPEMAMNAR